MNPAAVTVMAEIGIDISEEFPKPWTEQIVQAADIVVTMGCGDACPLFPSKRYEDWVLDDPAGKSVDEVRPVRDEIGRRVRGLLTSIGVDTAPGDRAKNWGAVVVPFIWAAPAAAMLRDACSDDPGSS